MQQLIAGARALGDAGFFLWRAWPPWLGVLCLALLLGVVFLLVFRALTPQRRVRRLKELMAAAIYELRLFADSPRRVLAAQGRALLLALEYLAWSIPALLVILPLSAALLARGALVWEHRPLSVGETAVVAVAVDRAAPLEGIRLEAQPALRVVPPIVRVRSSHEVLARVRVMEPGEHVLRVRVDSARSPRVIDKSLSCGPSAAISLVRARGRSLAQLLGREPPLPDGPVLRIEVDYPARELRWLGLPWYALLGLGVLVVALALRRRLRVAL
jgi:hypothetical protein